LARHFGDQPLRGAVEPRARRAPNATWGQLFQKKHELETSGEVNEATANKINDLIEGLDEDEPETHVISGRVVRSNGGPVKGAKIELSRLRREALIELVRRVQRADGTEEEIDEWLHELESAVPHAQIGDLIFYPDKEMSPETIVDLALRYTSIELSDRS
jgi:hypothetical protein